VYVYNAQVVGVHDGDTLTVLADLGFHTWHHATQLRIAGISALELPMPGGAEARDHLTGLLPEGTPVLIRSIRVDRDPADAMSFDRYVVAVQLPNGSDLAGLLVATGWAVWWNGRTKPTPYPVWPIAPTS
jgi:endonuclease YncB( thermonuclease family)